MRMNRRNVLLGLGTIVAGGGAVLGSGAFSQVEADRTVTIDVAGDASALVALEVDQDYDTGGDEAGIDLSADNLGDADGLNRNGTTTFDAMLAVTNQHDSAVDFTLPDESGPASSDGGEIDVWLELNANFDVDSDGNFGSDSTASTTGSVDGDDSVASGETAVYDLVVDVNDASLERFDVDVTITADES